MKTNETKYNEALGYMIIKYNEKVGSYHNIDNSISTKQFQEIFNLFIQYTKDIEVIFKQD